jgi:hypothetical protein
MTHWYVALDGDDDANSGQSLDSPFRHVGHAIDPSDDPFDAG